MAITTLNNLAINRSDTAAADQLWTATSATATDFQAAAAGGNLLQLKTAYKQDVFTVAGNSGTWSDVTDMTVDISPTLSTSKILVMLSGELSNATAGYGLMIKLLRDSTDIFVGTAVSSRLAASFGTANSSNKEADSINVIYLDAPATTSSTTYKLQGMAETGSTFCWGRSGNDPDINYQGRYPGTITVMEIAVGVL